MNPQRYSGIQVRLRGYAMSSQHGMLLFDSRPEHGGVVVLIPDSRQEEAAELVNQSFGPEVVIGSRRVFTDVSGIFQYRQGERQHLVLVLDHVYSVAVEDGEVGP